MLFVAKQDNRACVAFGAQRLRRPAAGLSGPYDHNRASAHRFLVTLDEIVIMAIWPTFDNKFRLYQVVHLRAARCVIQNPGFLAIFTGITRRPRTAGSKASEKSQ